MGIVAELLNYVHYAFAALVLYVVWRYVSGLKFSAGGGLQALLARFQGPDHAAREARKKGDHLVAGRLYEDLEMFDEAVETYLEGNEQWAAASVLEKQRRLDRAAQLYHDAGDLKKAAEVYEAAGKPGRAAAVYVEDGNNLEAARAHGEAGDWQQAAQLYIKAGFPLRAAGAYEQLGEPLRAAECYESHFMENVAYATSGYGSTAPSRELATARKAGELFEQAEKPLRAREMYSRGGFFPEAARVSWELGEYERAAELYQRAEDLSSAAEAYAQAGDPVKAALLKGEVAFKENRMEEAAGLFQEGKDYLRAAELFETLELWERAARAYEDAASFGSAAGVYLRAGMKREAAAAFEQGGSWEDAARLYEESGDGAKAASLYEKAGLAWRSGLAAAESGDRQEAIRLLQQVPPGDENYLEATERLGELFVEAGMHSVAIERLGKALSGQLIGRANLPLYYWLARAHEARPDPANAAAIYKKVVAEDVGYRDAHERLSRLGTQAAAPASPPGSEPREPVRPASTLQPAVAGQRIGRYQIQRLLGQGAMGRVYVARDTMLERDVALKLMATPDDAEQRQRFEREARAIARMTHPNVVTVFDMGHADDGSVYIAMELLRGQDLLRALRQAPALKSLERRLAVILQVLAGLDHAHRAGIVHRDVKPANVFIGHDGSVRLMDFGVARLSTASLTGAGRVVGTADYMSPEQVQGGSVEGPSDLFSVGVMLFELITGQRPFRAGSLMATFYAVTHREPDWSVLPSGAVNAGLEPIVKRALAKDVADRYASASEMASALREVIRRRSEASGRSVEQLLDLSGTLGGQAPTLPEVEAELEAELEAGGVGGPAAEAPPTRPSARAPGVMPPPRPDAPPTLPSAGSPLAAPPRPPRPFTTPPAAGKPTRPPTVPPAAGAVPPRPGAMPPAAGKPPRPPTVPPVAGAPPPRLGTMPPVAGKPTRPPTLPPAAGAPPPRPATRPPLAGTPPPRGTARFHRQAEVGRGPLGTVFRAVDSTSGRSLALRVLPPRSDDAREAWATLLDDLRTAGRVTHPGLVRVLGMVEAEGRAQVLSELIEGYDLDTALAAGAMASSRVEALGRALIVAVAHVHERGLAHGSIRPSNVMLAGGAVRLADLGLGRLYEAIGPDTPYRAPERGLSPQADVYSLGAVLYHALTGAAPAEGSPGAPGELGALVGSCLKPDPASRPTAAELLARLGKRPA